MPDGERWAATPDDTAEWLAGKLDAEMADAVRMKRCAGGKDMERWRQAQAVWDDVYPRWVAYFRR